jgi:hypothetical protein
MRATLITAVIVAAVIAGVLGYTKLGHQLLYRLGFISACKRLQPIALDSTGEPQCAPS